jgi:hypothetical protein
MMMNKDLELVVDEPIPSHFYWTIVRHGQLGQLPQVVDYARGPLPTHSTALRIGATALRLLHASRVRENAEAAEMMSAMRVEWNVETMPAGLV